jgi:hypothetical protein
MLPRRTAKHTPSPQPSAAAVSSRLYNVRVRSGTPDLWLEALATNWGATLRVLSCGPSVRPPIHLVAWIEITFEALHRDGIIAFLHSRPRSCRVKIASIADDRILLRMASQLPNVCARIFARGGLCKFAPSLLNGPPEAPNDWGFIVSRDGLRQARSRGESSPGGLGQVGIVRVGGPLATAGLSFRQGVAIRSALRLGYFENPRRAGLEKVSSSLGVSSHATMELLRRGIRELVSLHGTGPYRVRSAWTQAS